MELSSVPSAHMRKRRPEGMLGSRPETSYRDHIYAVLAAVCQTGVCDDRQECRFALHLRVYLLPELEKVFRTFVYVPSEKGQGLDPKVVTVAEARKLRDAGIIV